MTLRSGMLIASAAEKPYAPNATRSTYEKLDSSQITALPSQTITLSSQGDSYIGGPNNEFIYIMDAVSNSNSRLYKYNFDPITGLIGSQITSRQTDWFRDSNNSMTRARSLTWKGDGSILYVGGSDFTFNTWPHTSSSNYWDIYNFGTRTRFTPSIFTQSNESLHLSTNGIYLSCLGYVDNFSRVFQLSTAFDVSSMSILKSQSISTAQASRTVGTYWSDDGLQSIHFERDVNKLYFYSYSTAFGSSTALVTIDLTTIPNFDNYFNYRGMTMSTEIEDIVNGNYQWISMVGASRLQMLKVKTI